MRLLLTRPAAQALPWVERLRAMGIDAAALPLLEIGPLEGAAAASALRQAWDELPSCALLMFVSANAVEHFFAHRPPAACWPEAGPLAGSTGPGTSAALRRCGVPAARIVEPAPDAPAFDSEALWSRLRGQDWHGRRVRVVRGEDGRDWFADTLRAAGADVDFVAAYRRAPASLDPPGRRLLQQALDRPAEHLWHFSSSEAARHLSGLLTADEAGRLGQARALATHPRIAQTLEALGWGRVSLIGAGLEAAAGAVAPGGRSVQSGAS